MILYFFGLLVLVVVGVLVFTTSVNRLDAGNKEARRELIKYKKQTYDYEKALRRIANGSGSPELEAQIALDQNVLE